MFGSRKVPVWRTAWRTAGARRDGRVRACRSGSLPASAQQPGRGRVPIKPASAGELRDWGPRDRRACAAIGELRLRDPDATISLVAGRTHERYDQFHRGVRVFGGDVAEQLDGGQVVSAFGNVYEGIDIDTSPAIDADRARDDRRGARGRRDRPHAGARHPARGDGQLTRWRGACAPPPSATSASTSSTRATARSPSSSAISRRRALSGAAQGVLGDTKKMSVSPSGGQFVPDRPAAPSGDQHLRHARATTRATILYLNEVIQLSANDLASDADNTWTDGATVDAHVYVGLDLRLLLQAVQPPRARQRDRSAHQPRAPGTAAGLHSELRSEFRDFYLNAFYAGDGVMVFGEGLPPGFTLGGQSW